MIGTTKKCSNCASCQSLYRKGIYSFWECGVYYCESLGEIIDKNGFCNNWQTSRRRYDLSVKRIDEVIEDVKWLLKDMKED